jgi:ankyrin repeat protein
LERFFNYNKGKIDINWQKNARIPLLWAVAMSNEAIVDTLLKAGAKEILYAEEKKALDMAEKNHQRRMISLLQR